MRLTDGAMCQCRGCGEYFVSTGAFDLHRIGNFTPARRRCMRQGEMTEEGFERDYRGVWMSPGIALRYARTKRGKHQNRAA